MKKLIIFFTVSILLCVAEVQPKSKDDGEISFAFFDTALSMFNVLKKISKEPKIEISIENEIIFQDKRLGKNEIELLKRAAEQFAKESSINYKMHNPNVKVRLNRGIYTESGVYGKQPVFELIYNEKNKPTIEKFNLGIVLTPTNDFVVDIWVDSNPDYYLTKYIFKKNKLTYTCETAESENFDGAGYYDLEICLNVTNFEAMCLTGCKERNLKIFNYFMKNIK